MNVNQNVEVVLKALDRAKANVPKDWEYISNDEEIMAQVMEMDYMPKPLSEHLGVSKDLLPAPAELEDDEIKIIQEWIKNGAKN